MSHATEKIVPHEIGAVLHPTVLLALSNGILFEQNLRADSVVTSLDPRDRLDATGMDRWFSDDLLDCGSLIAKALSCSPRHAGFFTRSSPNLRRRLSSSRRWQGGALVFACV
jgi:hypothetical protein